MTRGLLAGTAGLVAAALTACSGSPAAQVVHGRSRVDVAAPDLVSFKRHTDIPNCPKITARPVSGGMPSVTVACLGGGRSVDLAGLRGPMIVNFWQAYCGPCREEMPALAAYARSQTRVKVLGVDYLDVQPAAALQLARDSSVDYPLVADPAGNLAGQQPISRIPGLPFTAFLDASGRVVHLEAGAMSSRADVAAAARKYLGVAG